MNFFKKPVFVSISPNAEADDVWLALKLIFSPWKWIAGGAPQKFTEEFKKYLGVKFAFMFDSGRTSIYAVMKALGLKQGDEVLVQAFTCTAAINPILWVGAKPVYVDIDARTYNMSPDDLLRKISPKSKAVMVQHTFGIAANLQEILEIAGKNNLMVIEDAAHALGAEWNGRKIGTFGDAAIFSFGRYKIISSVFGGAAVTNHPEIGKRLEEFYEKCDYPPRFWIFQQLFHPIFLSIAKPFYNIFSLGKLAVVIAKKLKLISLTVYSEEKHGGRPPFGPAKMPDALAKLGLNQLRKIEKYNNHRRALAEIYEAELRGVEEIALPEISQNQKAVFLNFPIRLKSGDLAYKLIGAGRHEEGIYLENWPAKKVIGPKGVDLEKLQYKAGSCPVAEEAAPRVIILPTSPNTTTRDAKRAVLFIKKAIAIAKK